MLDDNLRAGQLNAVINPELLFFARIAARYKGQTLIEFIEGAFGYAFAHDPAFDNDLNVDAPKAPKSPVPQRFLSLWDKEEGARVWNTALANWGAELLTPKQRRIFNDISLQLIKEGKQVTKENFVEVFNASGRG